MRKYLFSKLLFLLAPIALGSCAPINTVSIPSDYLPEVNGLCFDEEGEWNNFYNYCPSVMVDGDTAHVYYCSNKDSGVVGDHIAYREGRRKNGVWYWSKKNLVLFPGEDGEWDSGNVCDPDVIKGEFKYDDHTYSYLMTYLGCQSFDNSSNMFGFALADEPGGPWIKCKKVNPLYDFYEEFPDYQYKPGENSFIWGWGQSSLISLDKKGQVMLFFTGRSATGQACEVFDFSNMNDPKKISHHDISNNNITDLNGNKDMICNAQLVYDPYLKAFYMLSDQHPFNLDGSWPNNLPFETRITMINDFGSETIGDCFKNPNAMWVTLGAVDKETTGFDYNHNCCFERDVYGHMINQNKVDIFYTMCVPGNDWKVLYTYRIHRFTFEF